MTSLSHELNTSAATDGSVSTLHLPDTYAPSKLYTPAQLRDATMEEYIEFLQNYLEKGGKIANIGVYPFSYFTPIKMATTSGTVQDNGTCILVPEGREILRLKKSANARTYGSTLYMQGGYESDESAVTLPRNVARAMGWNFKAENFKNLADFEQIEFWQQEEFIAAQNGTTIPEVEAEKGRDTLYPASVEDEAAFMIKFLQNGGAISSAYESLTKESFYGYMAMCSVTLWGVSSQERIIAPEGVDIKFIGKDHGRICNMKDGHLVKSNGRRVGDIEIERSVAEKMMEMGFKFKKHHFTENDAPNIHKSKNYKTVKQWKKEARWKKPAVEAKNTAPALPAQKTARAVFNDVVREGNKLTYVDQNRNPLVTGTVDENGKKHGIWEHMQIHGRGRFVCFNHGEKVDAAAHLEELIQNADVANIVLAQEADDSCASAVLGAGSLLRDAQESLESINRMERQEQQKVWEPHY